MFLRHALVLVTSAALTATAAQAQSTTWNLASPATGGGAQDNRCVLSAANTQGNVATCNANDPSEAILTVRGYAFSSASGAASNITVSRASLNNQGGSGLGLCNSGEGWNCSGSPNHAIDNANTFTDFILLQSSPLLVLNSVSFGWTSGDADFTVLRYTGAADPLTALNSGQSMQGMFDNGWSVVSSVNGGGAGTYSGFNAGNLASTHWIVATRNSVLHNGANTSGTDASKINQVNGTIVPEPGSLALMGAGMIGLFGVARRRRV
jgi:hypothetical protein